MTNLIPTKPLCITSQETFNFDRTVLSTDEQLFKDFPDDLWGNDVVMAKIMDNINANNDKINEITQPDYIINLVKEYENNKQLQIQKITDTYRLVTAQITEFIQHHAKYDNIMKITIQGKKYSVEQRDRDIQLWYATNPTEKIVADYFVGVLIKKGWKPRVETDGKDDYDPDYPISNWIKGEKLIITCNFN